MNWLVFAGSLAAVLLLGGIAAWLKLGGKDAALGGPEEAMRAAEGAPPGFGAPSGGPGAGRRAADRKSVVLGKRVDFGGARIL